MASLSDAALLSPELPVLVAEELLPDVDAVPEAESEAPPHPVSMVAVMAATHKSEISFLLFIIPSLSCAFRAI